VPRASAGDRPLVVGTRGSALALAQARSACEALQRLHPGLAVELRTIATRGDLQPTTPLDALGRGAFSAEIESALRAGEVDVAVHSAKDLPSILPPDVTIAAFPRRADARDVLVSAGPRLRELAPGARVGTSSPRRICQVRALRPDLTLVELRGNVDTRLRAVAEGRLDAIVIAGAGLVRLGRAQEAIEWLDAETVTPCVGQGVLALQVRTDDADTRALVAGLDDAPTRVAVEAERAFLADLGAGCMAAVAAHAWLEGDRVVMRAMIGARDGRRCSARGTAPLAEATVLGTDLARELLQSGAAAFLASRAGPLRGLRVAVTRGGDQSALLSLLRAHGAIALASPTVAIVPADGGPAATDAAIRGLEQRGWVAFTSMNAVSALADRMAALGVALPSGVRVAAVGPGTAAVVARRLQRPADFVPATPSADALGASLPDVEGRSVLFPCGDLARDDLVERLGRRGARVDRVVVYRTVEGEGVAALREQLRAGALDVLIFASPSSIAPVAEAVADAPARPILVCVGPTTARYARSVGLEPDVVAATPSTGGIVDALQRYLA
jgi:hydroxymethylbilane synthase